MIPPNAPPGSIWPGDHPSHPWVPPSSGGQPPQPGQPHPGQPHPSHPIVGGGVILVYIPGVGFKWVVVEPGMPRPDQGLPGAQPGIDNTLPGSQPHPDQGLPPTGTNPPPTGTTPPPTTTQPTPTPHTTKK